MHRRDNVDQRMLTVRKTSLEVARQHRFDRVYVLPFAVLRCHGLNLVESEEELKRKGSLRPQRAVIVEGGEAFFRRDIVWAAGLRDACDAVEDRLLGLAIGPRGQGIIYPGPVAL
jgi:hypothetical protein